MQLSQTALCQLITLLRFFTTYAGSSAHTSWLIRTRGSGRPSAYPQLAFKLQFHQQPVTQHLKSYTWSNSICTPTIQLLGLQVGRCFFMVHPSITPKCTPPKRAHNTTLSGAHKLRNSTTTMHNKQQQICINCHTVSQIVCNKHNVTNHS